MRKISKLFGVGPEYAAQLEECGIRTILDLAQAEDLEELSACADIPHELLLDWKLRAQREVPAWAFRRKLVIGLSGVAVALGAIVIIWSSQRTPSPAQRAYEQALMLYRGGQYTEAERIADEMLTAGAGTAALHNLRGVLYRARGSNDSALEQYSRAVELDSGYAYAFNNIGNVHLDRGEVDASLTVYRKALELRPQNQSLVRDLYLNMSVAYTKKGNAGQAKAFVDSALTVDPDFSPALIQRGVLQHEDGVYDQAEISYERAIDSDPNNALAHYDLYLLYRDHPNLGAPSHAAERLRIAAPDAAYTRTVLAMESEALASVPDDRIEAASGDSVAAVPPPELPPPVDEAAAVADAGVAGAEAAEEDEQPEAQVEQPDDELEQPVEPEPEAPPAAPAGEEATPHDVNPTLKDRRRAGRIIERYYPQELKNRRVEGTVEVWVYIDVEGKVQESRVNTSSGDERLDNAALRAAREFEFNPAQNRGDPVPVWVSVPITFSVR